MPLNDVTSADDLLLRFWHLPFLTTPVSKMVALTLIEPVIAA